MNPRPTDYELYQHPSFIFSLACYCLTLFDKSRIEGQEFCTLLSFVFPCLLHNECTGIGTGGRNRLETKKPCDYLLLAGGIDIAKPFHAYPVRLPRPKKFSPMDIARNFSPRTSTQNFSPVRCEQNSSPAGSGQNFLVWGLMENLSKRWRFLE